MDVVVLLKSIPDPEAPPESFVFDGPVPDTSAVPWVLGPFEENALELGLRLAQGSGGALRVIAMGGVEQDKGLRKALALGAAEALRVESPSSWQDPLVAARVLAAGVAQLGAADLYVVGRLAGDWDRSVTGGLLAGLLGVPYLARVCDAAAEEGGVRLRQEVPGGTRSGRLSPPAVLGVTNAPTTMLRMVNVRDLLLAARRPMGTVTAASFLADDTEAERLASIQVSARRLGRAGRRVTGEAEGVARALVAELGSLGMLPEVIS